MPRTKRPTIAICYDFDGTLSPGNMQEYDFIPQLKLKTKRFWDRVRSRAKTDGADEVLTYMCLMVQEARHAKVRIDRRAFLDFGKKVELFRGVADWFPRIDAYAKSNGVQVDHFIISSGLKEMIEGTSIAKHFKKIYASAFMYDQHDVADWPALAINYTTKTQFLFRINKGLLDVWDNSRINAYIPQNERPVPFKRMIFIGDGTTDIPCMRLVKEQGGYSVAVFRPNTKRDNALQLLKEDRVNFVAPADYTEGHRLEKQVKAVIARIVADCAVERGER
jgi:phosphoserine phosphatase